MDARPRSSQTVSVTYDDSSPAQGRDLSRLRVELSECIETKTVTTTTTTKRTFPPLTMREARPLSSLDGKEYPLANTPLPPELVSFSYTIPSGGELGPVHLADETSRKRSGKEPLVGRHVAGLIRGNDSAEDSIRQASASPSNSFPRNTRKSGAWEDSPDGSPGPSGPKQQQDRLAGHPLPLGERPALRLFKRLNRTTREPSRGNRGGGFLATPDTSDLMLGSASDRASRSRPSHLERLSRTPEHVSAMTSQPHDEGSPVGSDSHTVFSSNVATPPITDADAEPFADADESLQQAIRVAGTQALDSVAAQDASLPSPRLSPTLAAQQPQQDLDPADDATSLADAFDDERGRAWYHESQTADELGEESDANSFAAEDSQLVHLPTAMDPHATMLDVRSMVETFDSMPNEMKSFMMYNFLRRCSRKTLRLVADTVTPVLKCDFLKQMPPELQLNVLSYLDYRDLCRAAQVSKHWRHVVDSNETGWKELFDQDGYSLPPGELDRAIAQGWGWQDPVGPLSAEIDLSQMNRLTSADGEAAKAPVKPDPLAKLRSSAKRKRGMNIGGADRNKRRASVHFEASRVEAAQSQIVKQHKSRGILTAASAAAAAVPDPDINLPSLRKMHLFKSLYRRHHMIQRGWTSGQVKPGHVAFAAHPRHVITCLQFDEDKIITGSDDTLIHVYDTKTGKLRKKLEGHEGGVWALQYEGNTLVSGSTDRSVRVWDIEKGFCTQVFYGHTSTVRCLQILMPTEIGRNHKGKAIMMPQKPLIITGSRDSQLRVWRLPEPGSRRYIQTGPPANDADCPYFIRTLTGHTHSVRAISAHGDTLVSGSYDSTVRVWRISTGESLHVLAGHSQKVYSVVYDHERNRCISGSMDSLVKIWDLNTGACLHTLEGHSLLVGLLDLRDQRLVSAAADSTLRIWDPESGKCRNVLSAHTGAITCFQHDGRKVISGSEKTVKMWDIRTGECVQDLLTDLSGVWQVKFNERRCVAAVQRGALTYIEILDFGAVRDGMPPEELGQRRLLNEQEVHSLMAEDV